MAGAWAAVSNGTGTRRDLCRGLFRRPGQALDVAAEATALREFKDWWWKARLGKCYYQLGEVPSSPATISRGSTPPKHPQPRGHIPEQTVLDRMGQGEALEHLCPVRSWAPTTRHRSYRLIHRPSAVGRARKTSARCSRVHVAGCAGLRDGSIPS